MFSPSSFQNFHWYLLGLVQTTKSIQPYRGNFHLRQTDFPQQASYPSTGWGSVKAAELPPYGRPKRSLIRSFLLLLGGSRQPPITTLQNILQSHCLKIRRLVVFELHNVRSSMGLEAPKLWNAPSGGPPSFRLLVRHSSVQKLSCAKKWDLLLLRSISLLVVFVKDLYFSMFVFLFIFNLKSSPTRDLTKILSDFYLIICKENGSLFLFRY